MKNMLSKYSYETKIISIYTFCLALVYGSLVYVETRNLDKGLRIGLGITCSLLIVIVGILTLVFYIRHKEKINKESNNIK